MVASHEVGEREDLERYREVAARAALAAGRVILASPPPEPEVKGPADYVTEADRAAERAARGVLDREAPDIPVVGEELGGLETGDRWLVDPIDGTANFLHGFPVVGVSVALVSGDGPVAAAVHAPFLDTTWTAAGGQGAEQDGSPLAVSSRRVAESVVGTGFPFRDKRRLPRYLAVMTPALERFEDLRRPGAVALDLAWVSAGVFDGFFEVGLAPWDVAAGGLLIREAGGVVTDWEGGDGWLGGDVLAGNPEVHDRLLRLAKEAPPSAG